MEAVLRANFTAQMNNLGVEHVKSSTYNSPSNGGAKRTVQSINQELPKEGEHPKSNTRAPPKNMLQSEQPRSELTHWQRSREILQERTNESPPKNIEREVDWRSMLTRRTNQQTKHVNSKKERKSRMDIHLLDYGLQ